jgi:hypothetical protein
MPRAAPPGGRAFAAGTTLSFKDLYFMFSSMFIFLIPRVWFAKPPFTMAAAGGGH